MRTNLEKWNYYTGILNQKAEVFLDSISPVIPSVFYKLYSGIVLIECTVTKRRYRFSIDLSYKGKKPTRKELEQIIALYNSEIDFKAEKAYFDYFFFFNQHKESKAETTINVKHVFENKIAFISKDAAEKYRLHKKTSNVETSEVNLLSLEIKEQIYEKN